MPRFPLAAITFFYIFFIALGYVSGKPSYNGFKLTDRNNDKTLALIIGIIDDDSSKAESHEENKVDENNDTKELINLLWMSKNFQLKRDQDKKSVELSDSSSELAPPYLRAGCQNVMKCVNKCQKKKEPKQSCQNICQIVFDSYDQCKTTTTRDPCDVGDPCAPKWGKTMPPKWKLLLRAITQSEI